MKAWKPISIFLVSLCLPQIVSGSDEKTRIFIVSSYHSEYLWSQDTHAGVCNALLEVGYLDNTGQVHTFTENDYVESSKVVIQKTWMDTKRKNSRKEIARATTRIVKEIDAFGPDMILLGDDNAVNYIGNNYIDTDIPIVFWGVNGLPLKYGLLDSIERPGHNVTGIYQAGYLKKSLESLKKLVPSVNTFVILSDDSPTGRSKVKEIEGLARTGRLPVKHVGSIVTNSFSEWKSKALERATQCDAFFVVNHNTLKDDSGKPVSQMEAGAWYLRNIKKPDCAHERQFAKEGILLVVDDSGFKQGYEAVKTAYQILDEGKNPAHIFARAPGRGPIIVNRERARMLGIDLEGKDFIEEFIDTSLAFKIVPE